MTRECRVCGVAVEAGTDSCPSCGAPFSGTTESFEPVVIAAEGPDGVSEPLDGPVLIVRKGPQAGERFYLDRSQLTVGRDPASDIFLNDMTVSRSHAFLELLGGRLTVRDAESLNGTYVNGVCVDVAELSDGDVLQIGTFQMIFVGGAGAR